MKIICNCIPLIVPQKVCKHWYNLLKNFNPLNTPYAQDLIARKDEKTANFKGTLLHEASEKGDIIKAMILIKGDADVNALDFFYKTPLHDAAFEGKTEIVNLLIKNGADLNVREKWGRTPLYLAEKQGYTDIVKLLCEAMKNLDDV